MNIFKRLGPGLLALLIAAPVSASGPVVHVEDRALLPDAFVARKVVSSSTFGSAGRSIIRSPGPLSGRFHKPRFHPW